MDGNLNIGNGLGRRISRAVTLLSLLLLLGACAPQTAQDATPPAPATPAQQPAESIGPMDPSAGAQVDYGCERDDQCVVKNVGNCCGEMPACVNVDSPTFPDRVKADCQREGRMAICGHPVISGCRCVEQRCQAAPGLPVTTPTQGIQ